MSIFEILMLVCWGSAWPFSIHKSYTSRSTKGKSLVFLLIALSGYVCSILHKIFYSYDYVIYLYLINMTMVSIDILLYLRNRRFQSIESIYAESNQESFRQKI